MQVIAVRRDPQRDGAELALSALRRVLADVPGVQAIEITERDHGDWRTEWEYGGTVRIRGEVHGLRIVYRSSGQPRYVREAANRLLQNAVKHPGDNLIFAAPYISPRSAEICREAGIGYVDSAGNCRLTLEDIYIYVSGNGNPYTVKRDLRSLYSPKAERVLRVLVDTPGRAWRIHELASEASVSIGQVANVKSLLTDREWIAVGPDGLELTQPGVLLDEWATHYESRRQEHEAFFCLRGPADIELGIGEACKAAGVAYALTGLSAAARTAPFVRYERADAYIGGPLQPVIDALELKRVPAGQNVRIRIPYDEGVLYGAREHEGITIVSPLQAYLDLRAEGGRAGDGAAFLREHAIEAKWSAVA